MRIKAYVNHGRWVAECPDVGCRGAELVKPGVPFVCGSCHRSDFLKKGNGKEYGHKHSVQFPAWKETIERILAVRPTENRNWWIGEAVSDLRRENRKHGLPEAI